MAEAKTEEPVKKKKGGKLPIIIALVAVLGGGGFFFMKSKGGKPKAKPKMELAAKETELEEFLTNMADGTTYVRAKIAVKLCKEFDGKPFAETEFTENVGAIRDAVNTVLRSKRPEEIKTIEGMRKLKRDLAEAMNTALEGPPIEAKPEEQKKEEPAKPTRKGKGGEAVEAPTKDAAPEKHEDWDSPTGPVLQVFLSSIATQ